MAQALRVLVVDDTSVYRKIVSDILREMPMVEVVGTAHHGRAALTKIPVLKPDLLTLDIEMPEMTGLQVLSAIRERGLDVGAVVLSTLTQEGGALTMQALELGAFDFIPKPRGGDFESNRKAIKEQLAPMLRAYRRRREIQTILKGKAGSLPLKTETPTRPKVQPRTGVRHEKSEIVAVGVSTGGPNALARVIPTLPADLGVPIVVVQHMPPLFTQSLATRLNGQSVLRVKEAENGEPLQENTVYIAPGGKHMKVAAGSDGRQRVIRITDDPPENFCKPAADLLFRSVAHHYVGRATGVIMTGMGADGTLGLKLMKRNGALVIAQDEASCVVYGMPKEAVAAGVVDRIVPLGDISSEILKSVRSR